MCTRVNLTRRNATRENALARREQISELKKYFFGTTVLMLNQLQVLFHFFLKKRGTKTPLSHIILGVLFRERDKSDWHDEAG